MSDLVNSFAGFLSAVLVPCIAIIGGISYAAYSMYLKVRRQRETLQMYHLERMAAIEKGIDLPPLPPELVHGGYDGGRYRGEYRRRRRTRGLTMVFVGAVVSMALWQVNGDKSFWWGLVIVAWGLGRLVSDHMDGDRAPYSAPGASSPAGNGGPFPPGST